MRGGRLTVIDLRRVKHYIKRVDRRLAHRHLHQEGAGVYAALAQLLIASTPRPVLIVDGSDLAPAKTHFLWRASGPVRGRALTLDEEVLTPATQDKPKTPAAFLDTLAALLPPFSSPMWAFASPGFVSWNDGAGTGSGVFVTTTVCSSTHQARG
jgi:hypothetical protein